jgi:hypothetical protein
MRPHLLDVETGRLQTPGEVRVEGDRIVTVGARSSAARVPRSSISAGPP